MPQKIVFPVLATVTYVDDFGDPRPGGVHQGIDIMAPKRSLALAAEAGKVEFWTTSASAGCMLYLHGASGTDYQYIHLNNDLTAKNDNRGKCVAGTAYAKGLKDGAKVVAGQPIGYVGDSGDANGIHPHLHFELHPGRGKAVDAYPWLQRATHLLFSAPRGMPFTLELRGTVASVTDDTVQLRLTAVSAWPMRQHQSQLKRKLLVSVPADATVQRVPRAGARGTPTTLVSAKPNQQIDIWTAAAPSTLKAQRGDDLALSASLVSLIGS
ncbi:MAG TPA: M23 family metallopeptidase [Gaiellaceae bacterium]|nr:M23 family metallopeptidase [Gaiellaceae bacterium]